MRSILKIGLTIFLICLLSAKTYPSRGEPETYVSKSGYLNLLTAQDINGSAKVDSFKLSKLKSPWMALGIALIPGAIVHGAGHFYAGKTTTGYLLLGAEAVGGFLLYAGFLSAFKGPAYQTETDLIGWTGVILFCGSWVYDAIGSPIAVMMGNKNSRRRKAFNLKFEFNDKDDSIKIVLIRQF